MFKARAGLALAIAFAGVTGVGIMLAASPAAAAPAPGNAALHLPTADQQGKGRPRGLVGVVTVAPANSTDSITLTTRKNETKTVKVDSATSYLVKGKPGSVTDVIKDSHVVIQLTAATAGQTPPTAAKVIVLPPRGPGAPSNGAKPNTKPNGGAGHGPQQRQEVHAGEITVLSATSITIKDHAGKTFTGTLNAETRKFPADATFAAGDKVVARGPQPASATAPWVVTMLGKHPAKGPGGPHGNHQGKGPR